MASSSGKAGSRARSKLGSRQGFAHLPVAPSRQVNDLGRQFGRRRVAVPGDGCEVVADDLLVVAVLGLAWAVEIGQPEAGRVGGERLVDEDHLAVAEAELQLGVRDENPLPAGG